MQQNRVNFVLLQYSRCFNDDEAFRILLVHYHNEDPLEVWIPPNWAQRVETADRPYLCDLVEDWRSTRPDQIPALIDELCRQSQGPIKLIDRGHISGAEYRALIQKVSSESH